MYKTIRALQLFGFALFLWSTPAVADELPGIPWVTGGFVDTGAGYDMASGWPKRTVVDFEVPGSVGQYPLRAARTLVVSNTTIVHNMRSQWIFDFHYVAVGAGLETMVRYPTGSKVMFYAGADDFDTARSVGDRLTWVNGKMHLLMADGGRVEFEPWEDGSLVGVKIVDRHGLVTKVEHQNIYGPSKVTDPTGRFLVFTWVGNKVSRITASTGEVVSLEWQEQIVSENPLITKAVYADGSQATYRYSGLNESCGSNLPLELNDTRSTSKMPHVLYTWRLGWPELECTVDSEIAGGTTTQVSSRRDVEREVLPNGKERRFVFHESDLVEKHDFLGNVEKYDYDSRGFLSKVTDRLNRATRFTHEPIAGQLLKVEYADGKNVSYTYTRSSKPYYLATKTDERGNVTSYDYHPNGVLKAVHYADGTSETWDEHDSFAQPRKHTLRNGAVERFDYDSMGRLTSHWLPAEGTPTERVRFQYYADGHPWEDLLKTETDALGNATTYEYTKRLKLPELVLVPVSGRDLPERVLYADGTSRSFSYDARGNKTREVDELGHDERFTYDAYNRLLTKTDKLDRVTRYDYQDQGSTRSALSHTSQNPRKVTSPGGKVTLYHYDVEERLSSVVDDPGGIEAERSFTYDAVGNIKTQTDPEGRVTSYSYDKRDRKTQQIDPGSLTTKWAYDAAGNTLSTTYADLSRTAATYDSMNRVSTRTDESDRVTRFEYTASGKVKWIVDPRGAKSGYVYDARDRVTQRNSPGSVLGSYREHEKLFYDANGNLTKKRDRRGVEIVYAYDARNREVSRIHSDGTPRITTVYDAAGRPTAKHNGQEPQPFYTPIHSIEYTYNPAGELIEEAQRVHAVRRIITYTYDTDGNVDQAVWLYGNVDYTWDALNRLTKIASSSPTTIVSYKYFADSQQSEKTLGNGLKASFEYDDAGRLAYISGTSTTNRFLDYDGRNRPVRIASGGGRFTETFEYFPDSQLKKYQRSEPPAGLITQEFTYDGSGNRRSQSFDGNSTDYAVNGANLLTDTIGAVNYDFSQDSAGNTTARGSQQFEYDAYWRLTKITTPPTGGQAQGTEETFLYDAQGRLSYTTKTGPSTNGVLVKRRAIHMGDRPVAWYDSTGVVEQTYWGHRGDEPVYTWRKEGGSFYYHLDHQNNVTTVSNSSGDALEFYLFDPFGTPHYYQPTGWWTERSSSAVVPPYLFTGQMWLSTYGLHHYKARVYDPRFGRFLQPDPGFIEAGDLNLFRYVANNPYTYVDPKGRWVETLWDLANVAMDMESLAANIAEGHYGQAALDAGALLVDGAATVLPGVPGGAGAGLKAVRGGQKAVDGAKGVDNVSDAVKTAAELKPKAGSTDPASAGKPFSQTVKDQARAESGNTCVFCKTKTTDKAGPNKSEIDHAVPKSRGGDNTADNAQNTCRTCNRKKGAKTTEEFENDTTP